MTLSRPDAEGGAVRHLSRDISDTSSRRPRWKRPYQVPMSMNAVAVTSLAKIDPRAARSGLGLDMACPNTKKNASLGCRASTAILIRFLCCVRPPVEVGESLGPALRTSPNQPSPPNLIEEIYSVEDARGYLLYVREATVFVDLPKKCAINP